MAQMDNERQKMTQEEFEATLDAESGKDPDKLVIYFNDGSHWEYPIKWKALPLPGIQMSVDGVQLPGEAVNHAFSSITAVVGHNDAEMTVEGEVTFDVDNDSDSKTSKDLRDFLDLRCPKGWVLSNIDSIDTFRKRYTIKGNHRLLAKAAFYWP